MNDLKKNVNLLLLFEVRKDALTKSKDVEYTDSLFAVMYDMDILIRTAGKEGLLALEEVAKNASLTTDVCQELQAAVFYACNGLDTEDVIEILTARYWRKNPQGEDALLYFMIILSVIRIQDGASPYLLESLLLACVPDETAQKYRAYKKQRFLPGQGQTPMEIMLNSNPNIGEGGILVVKRLLEEKIAYADEDALRRAVRDITESDFIVSLKGLSVPAKKSLFSVIPDDKADEYARDCEYMGPVRQIDVMAAMSELLAIFESI